VVICRFSWKNSVSEAKKVPEMGFFFIQNETEELQNA